MPRKILEDENNPHFDPKSVKEYINNTEEDDEDENFSEQDEFEQELRGIAENKE